MATRVLVVDDQADVADTFHMMLDILGHSVEVTYSAQQALKMLRSSKPSFALADMPMPGMDADRFLLKPVTPADLAELLNT